MCCLGCGYCAVSIRAMPEAEEQDEELDLPAVVVRNGVSMPIQEPQQPMKYGINAEYDD